MNLSIMQPYFFPYLGYFSLIENSDYFILFDTPQYIRHGWINRNRILKSSEDLTYITVPIQKASRSTPINEIKIDNQQNWKQNILGKLSFYKKIAPNYYQTISFLNDLLSNDFSTIIDLNYYTIIEICNYLDIRTKIDLFSSLNINLPTVNAPDEWALEITKRLNYDTYINPIGGLSFFEPQKYFLSDINLLFLNFHPTPYIQRIGHFEANLSIIDCLMFCNPPEIKKMLQNFSYITPSDTKLP